jgi:N-acetyl-1-D-myo-inositol-2-amino-2-deoxy-alpha-D-glucopyranoside deacetylase
MSAVTEARRLLLVHAHPDDETIGSGATMARYAADGAHVTLVTCTLGEEGEILVPELEGLAADKADQLGGYRLGELDDAMRELGVTDHRMLGGAATAA